MNNIDRTKAKDTGGVVWRCVVTVQTNQDISEQILDIFKVDIFYGSTLNIDVRKYETNNVRVYKMNNDGKGMGEHGNKQNSNSDLSGWISRAVSTAIQTPRCVGINLDLNPLGVTECPLGCSGKRFVHMEFVLNKKKR